MPVIPNKRAKFLEDGKTLITPGKKPPSKSNEEPVDKTKGDQMHVRPELTAEGIRKVAEAISRNLLGRGPTAEESARSDTLIEKFKRGGKLPADDE